jgi:hypothetical protein
MILFCAMCLLLFGWVPRCTYRRLTFERAPGSLARWVSRERITVCHATPALTELLGSLLQVREMLSILCAGCFWVGTGLPMVSSSAWAAG